MTLANQAFNTVGNGVDQQRAAVFETFDYEKFSFLSENRDLGKAHLNNLKNSMKDEALLSPILVNEKMQIIDGQHRFTARMELGLPIPYIICHNYGLNEVQILNANAKTWTFKDYLNSYVSMGYQDYITLKRLKEEYAFLDLTILMGLLRDYNNKIGFRTANAFKEGNYKIKSYNKAKQICNEIQEMKEFWPQATKAYFILAYKQARDLDAFNSREFINKVKKFPRKMQDCANINQFRHMIHDLYNYKAKNRVELRPL